MSLPNRDSGAMSRQIQRQMPATAAGGAAIGLYLINLCELYLANILRYALSHPSRMYQVGHRFWGVLTLIAFVQGAFQIGGPVLVHPTLMFLLLGIVLSMSCQMNVIDELRTIRHDKSEEHYSIFIGGLEAETPSAQSSFGDVSRSHSGGRQILRRSSDGWGLAGCLRTLANTGIPGR